MKFFFLVAADRGGTGGEYDDLELQGNQKGWSAENGQAPPRCWTCATAPR
jgi:hypothetical protein